MATVVAGSSVPGLAMDIAKKLGAEFTCVSMARFPDGELHVNIQQHRLPGKVYYGADHGTTSKRAAYRDSVDL